MPRAHLPRRSAITVVEVLIVVLIVAVLAAIAVPNFRAARERDDRAFLCYSAQKTIIGAVEMYNLDKSTKRTGLDEAFFQALRSGGYLQSLPQDIGGGPGSWVNFRTTQRGTGITCVVHGPAREPIEGEPGAR